MKPDKDQIRLSKLLYEAGVSVEITEGMWFVNIRSPENGVLNSFCLDTIHNEYKLRVEFGCGDSFPILDFEDAREELWKRKWRILRHLDGYAQHFDTLEEVIQQEEIEPDMSVIEIHHFGPGFHENIEIKYEPPKDTTAILEALLKVVKEGEK